MDEELHMAAADGDVETIQELLADGADPNVKGDMEYTALHFAAEEGILKP